MLQITYAVKTIILAAGTVSLQANTLAETYTDSYVTEDVKTSYEDVFTSYAGDAGRFACQISFLIASCNTVMELSGIPVTGTPSTLLK